MKFGSCKFVFAFRLPRFTFSLISCGMFYFINVIFIQMQFPDRVLFLITEVKFCTLSLVLQRELRKRLYFLNVSGNWRSTHMTFPMLKLNQCLSQHQNLTPYVTVDNLIKNSRDFSHTFSVFVH